MMKIREIPAGVTWERTGRLSWIATVRQEPETVYETEANDYADLNRMAQASALSLSGSAFGVQPLGPGLIGGYFEGLF